uniref:Nitrogen fixation protein NifU n=1 Tax=Candidatus Kentrum sp. LFY TaxID=2126342 RepID=A0A450WJR5_9GAMM|nr:MAG: nitrogen fixation protein NifU [Candidatus Kentron sp. LFY]
MSSDLIIKHFTNPRFVGRLENPEMEIEVIGQACGDRLLVQVQSNDGMVSDVAFQVWGTAASMAAADIFCESIKGKVFSEISDRDDGEIEAMLGELEPSEHHCIDKLIELHRFLIAEAERQGVM